MPHTSFDRRCSDPTACSRLGYRQSGHHSRSFPNLANPAYGTERKRAKTIDSSDSEGYKSSTVHNRPKNLQHDPYLSLPSTGIGTSPSIQLPPCPCPAKSWPPQHPASQPSPAAEPSIPSPTAPLSPTPASKNSCSSLSSIVPARPTASQRGALCF